MILFGFLDFFSTLLLVFFLFCYGVIRIGKAAAKNPEQTATVAKILQAFLKR